MFPNYIPLSKRLFDILTASLLLLVLSPIFLILSILVWANHGRPVFFGQKRPGYQGKIFSIYKFRSMNNKRDGRGNLLPDEIRLTPLGRFLRSSSLDEIPELVNVLRGEMSLVGPRPLLVQYLDRYNIEQSRRHEVVPGITGLAQVNGRNALTWERKFLLDVWYVDHWSFWLDMRIIFQTVLKVFQREGINQPGHATAEEFMGNEKKD